MNTENLIENLDKQKLNLIRKIPQLKNYFIDIYLTEYEKYASFLPIRCFRDFNLHSTYSEQNQSQYIKFYSSGSTGNKPSTHIFSKESLQNYQINTCEGFKEFLNRNHFEKSIPIISFIPSPHTWQNSSLSAMIKMFQDEGFNIKWCNIDESPNNFVNSLKELPNNTHCIVFGTSFHHFMLANSIHEEFKINIKKEFKRLSLSIIDTGGTKGRTQAFTLNESIEILKSFYENPSFSFFSEYGMCELGSQAWSTQKIHDGSFQCNKTMLPYAISIEQKQSLPYYTKGFIAFIDTINSESYSAIITEDIGIKTNLDSFKLLGRGPDSSIKGCSLNVRNFFCFEDSSKRIPIEKLKPSLNQTVLKLENILLEMKLNDWSSFAINDLEKTLSSLNQNIPIDAKYRNKDMLIISAANTPIAWVFPYLIAAESGASSITIKIPSLRLDDYYSEPIRKMTHDLIQYMSQYFTKTKTYIDTSKSIAHTFSEYNIILTFGTDETLKTIENQLKDKNIEFIGKGDIKNSLHVCVDKQTPFEIAELCCFWNGRGCLTPVALLLDGKELAIEEWCHEFSTLLEQQFQKRSQQCESTLIQEFSHSHNCAFVTGQLKELNIDTNKFILKGKRTCVINLSQFNADEINTFEPDFNFGGCGFIYIFQNSLQKKYKTLKELNVIPKISEYN